MIDTLGFLKAALLMSVYVTLPPLLAAVIAGLIVSVLQTVFQLQDQTLPFVVKLFAVGAVLAASGRWIGTEVLRLASQGLEMVTWVGR